MHKQPTHVRLSSLTPTCTVTLSLGFRRSSARKTQQAPCLRCAKIHPYYEPSKACRQAPKTHTQWSTSSSSSATPPPLRLRSARSRRQPRSLLRTSSRLPRQRHTCLSYIKLQAHTNDRTATCNAPRDLSPPHSCRACISTRSCHHLPVMRFACSLSERRVARIPVSVTLCSSAS